MKKTYRIEVDCANCANKMEDAAKKIAGIKEACVNFMAQKMTLEMDDAADEKSTLKNVYMACRKIEPDCEIFF